MDVLARRVGIDPAEVRRRNFIAKDKFPYASAGGLVFDSGDYDASLTVALELADYEGLRGEQAKRRAQGSARLLGIGLSSYVEMCGLAPSRVLASLNYSAGGGEAATVRMLPTGKVQVVSGSSPHGQGHETSWSMIVADKLGVAPDELLERSAEQLTESGVGGNDAVLSVGEGHRRHGGLEGQLELVSRVVAFGLHSTKRGEVAYRGERVLFSVPADR
jgi:CO/xanthine dehydrogenase Mo-binding subunit